MVFKSWLLYVPGEGERLMAAIKKDVVIIGGGPAGLAAAVQLRKKGIWDILIIEREKHLGGILRQCIHDGFGLTRFKETLSGPEYSQRFIDQVEDLGIDYITDATVIDISSEKKVTAVCKGGLLEYEAKAVVLAMGCRERTRGAINIPGTRPSGVYNAGVAQAYVNLYNTMPGKEVIILGSGDIGMIMARRMTLEGAKVKAVFEIQPYPSGLPRNIEQCLNDYGIPLFLSHTITKINGQSRLEGITVSKVDENFKPIPGTEMDYCCDTLILSVGLIPENELSIAAGVELDNRTKGAVVDENYQTCVEGIFAAGNVLHVHDLVDFVSLEAESLSEAVAEYIGKLELPKCSINITTDANIGYTVPQRISGAKDFKLSMRVRKPLKNCQIDILQGKDVIKTVKFKKAIPAEMLHIKLEKDHIKSIDDLRVVVRC
jgi:NADPH-dependent 2,4-dienoyl-CoA reductase/sulfur reductase-like enzyme